MKVENILDYFGPTVNCRVKIRRGGEEKYCYERNDDYPESDIESAYVMEINIEQDETGSFLELVIE